MRLLNGHYQLVRLHILDQIPCGAGLHGRGDVLVFGEAGQGKHFHRRPADLDQTGRIYPVHPRHDQVHQDYVGLTCLDLSQGCLAIGGLSDHCYATVACQAVPQPHTYHRVIIHDEDSYGFHPSPPAEVVPAPELACRG